MGFLYKRLETRQKITIKYSAGRLFLAFVLSLLFSVALLSMGYLMLYYALWYAFLFFYLLETWHPAREFTHRMEEGAYIKSYWAGGSLRKSYVIEIYKILPAKDAAKRAKTKPK